MDLGLCAQVRARQLWGNEVYTQDSDLVAVLMHCGFYNHALSAPPASAAHVRAIVQPLPPQPAYHSRARNSIRSRAWGAAVEGCSYRVRHPDSKIAIWTSRICCNLHFHRLLPATAILLQDTHSVTQGEALLASRIVVESLHIAVLRGGLLGREVRSDIWAPVCFDAIALSRSCKKA